MYSLIIDRKILFCLVDREREREEGDVCVPSTTREAFTHLLAKIENSDDTSRMRGRDASYHIGRERRTITENMRERARERCALLVIKKEEERKHRHTHTREEALTKKGKRVRKSKHSCVFCWFVHEQRKSVRVQIATSAMMR